MKQTTVLIAIIAFFSGIILTYGTLQFSMMGNMHKNMGMMGNGEWSEEEMKNMEMGEMNMGGKHGKINEMMEKMDMGNSMNMDEMDMGNSSKMTMSQMSTMLEGLSGDMLDKMFLEGMIPHHQAAIDMARYLENSDREEMRKLGQDIIEVQTGEIQMMENWIKEWNL